MHNPINIIIIFGYTAACQIILAGYSFPSLEWVAAAAGAFVVGWHCSACDEKEGRR